MDLLLDTHIILWSMRNDPRLKFEIKNFINNPENKKFYSVSTLWEVAIKRRAKPKSFYDYSATVLHFCEQARMTRLPIEDKHILEFEKLPLIHGDPFENILVAQAIAEGMTLVTHDKALEGYGPNVLVV